MKYLLQALESRPGKVGLSDQELKQLLSDVKDGRETKGTDDWYESLEKVVQELRSTPEAHWFLKPVSKKDVKDYHTIVTRPMDLGTVLKKVKSHVYKNKQEFKEDIDLIWENCLLYNTSTTHPIRNQAIQMKRKADHHLEFLVDAAASHDDPLASLGMGKDEEDSDDEQAATNGQVGSKQAVGGLAKRERERQEGEAPPAGRKASKTGTGTPAPTRARSPTITSRRPLHRTAASMAKFQETDQSLDEASPPIAGPSRTPSRRHVAAKQAAALRQAQSAMGDVEPPSWELPPLGVASTSTNEGGEGEVEVKWWKKVAQEDMLRSGVPDTVGMVQDFRRRRKKGIGSEKGKERACEITPLPTSTTQPNLLPTPLPSKPSTSSSTSTSSSSSLSSKIHQNISSLQSIRRAHRKILDLTSTDPSEDPRIKFAHLEKDEDAIDLSEEERERRRLAMEKGRREALPIEVGGKGFAGKRKKRIPRDMEVSREEAMEGMKRTAGTVLAHVGFEGGSESAVDTLTDVFSNHLMNLGRTMRFYLDNETQTMTPEEIILHTLFENGTTEINQLDRYIKEDVEQYGSKLSELSKRMQQAYLESAEVAVVEDESIFNGDGEVFANNFVEDLGEDFFGTRDLGLDVPSTAVPSRLFRGKQDEYRLTNGPFGPTLPYPPPQPFVPLSLSSVPSQIGLLQPFYQSRFQQFATLPPPPPLPASPPPPPPPTLPSPVPTTNGHSTTTNGIDDPTPTPTPIVSTIDPPQPLPTPPSPILPLELLDDAFDPVLLKKLGPSSEIPTLLGNAAAGGTKRKQSTGTSKAKTGAGGEEDEESSPAKKKKKGDGPGKGNWKKREVNNNNLVPPPNGSLPPAPVDSKLASQPNSKPSSKANSRAPSNPPPAVLQTNGNSSHPHLNGYSNGTGGGYANGKMNGNGNGMVKVEPI